MRNKTIAISISIGIIIGIFLSTVVGALAGNPFGPDSPPDLTNSYTLTDLYNLLDSGTIGSQSAFTEPSVAPGTVTMHTLNEIINKAPALDNSNGAMATQVLSGTTYWGLRDGAWGQQTGAMSDNGDLTIVPTTTNQTIAPGYHSGRGYVVGDVDLVAGNIVSGKSLFGVIGMYPLAPIPKTGLTKCYDTDGMEITCAGTGQDGDWQKGVSFHTPRFIDNNDGTVIDNLTGLIWLKNANCFGTQTWANALSVTNDLNSGECGLSDSSVEGDWRLSNLRELNSLIHYGFSGPALPDTTGTGHWTEGDPFAGVQNLFYWSATSYPLYLDFAWNVYLFHGYVQHNFKTASNYVWPVRGGR